MGSPADHRPMVDADQHIGTSRSACTLAPPQAAARRSARRHGPIGATTCPRTLARAMGCRISARSPRDGVGPDDPWPTAPGRGARGARGMPRRPPTPSSIGTPSRRSSRARPPPARPGRSSHARRGSFAGRRLPGAGIDGDARWRRAIRDRAPALSFDLQAPWWHLGDACRCRAFPESLLVRNHTGLPADRSPNGIRGWRPGIASPAADPNTAVKIPDSRVPGRPRSRLRSRGGAAADRPRGLVARCSPRTSRSPDSSGLSMSRGARRWSRQCPHGRQGLFDIAARFDRLPPRGSRQAPARPLGRRVDADGRLAPARRQRAPRQRESVAVAAHDDQRARGRRPAAPAVRTRSPRARAQPHVALAAPRQSKYSGPSSRKPSPRPHACRARGPPRLRNGKELVVRNCCATRGVVERCPPRRGARPLSRKLGRRARRRPWPRRRDPPPALEGHPMAARGRTAGGAADCSTAALEADQERERTRRAQRGPQADRAPVLRGGARRPPARAAIKWSRLPTKSSCSRNRPTRYAGNSSPSVVRRSFGSNPIARWRRHDTRPTVHARTAGSGEASRCASRWTRPRGIKRGVDVHGQSGAAGRGFPHRRRTGGCLGPERQRPAVARVQRLMGAGRQQVTHARRRSSRRVRRRPRATGSQDHDRGASSAPEPGADADRPDALPAPPEPRPSSRARAAEARGGSFWVLLAWEIAISGQRRRRRNPPGTAASARSRRPTDDASGERGHCTRLARRSPPARTYGCRRRLGSGPSHNCRRMCVG
jgi:hypothetical protein